MTEKTSTNFRRTKKENERLKKAAKKEKRTVQAVADRILDEGISKILSK